jgi:hypothetical protein
MQYELILHQVELSLQINRKPEAATCQLALLDEGPTLCQRDRHTARWQREGHLLATRFPANGGVNLRLKADCLKGVSSVTLTTGQ